MTVTGVPGAVLQVARDRLYDAVDDLPGHPCEAGVDLQLAPIPPERSVLLDALVATSPEAFFTLAPHGVYADSVAASSKRKTNGVVTHGVREIAAGGRIRRVRPDSCAGAS